MANEEQVAILLRGVEGWNQWRVENVGVQPDLSDADLDGVDLRTTNLSGADLIRSNLVGANLSGADFNRANFYDADLSEASLNGADLSGADLYRTSLSNADFDGANLSDANFNDADLRNANFSNTDLIRTNLSDANLSGSKLFHANLYDTVFANVDLSEVEGLMTVRHLGPSSVVIDTIYTSRGQIPEIFLRGCGVPDIFIEYMSALTSKPFEFYSCFISYSHKDEAFATRLHDTLQGKGVRCWLDEEDAKLGVPISRNIEQGINLTDKFLLCCSKESLSSGWVDYEIDLALHKERNLRQVAKDDVWRIIPLDLDGHLFSPEYDGGALRIRDRLAGDFTGWKTDSDKFDRQIARVIQAIRIEER